MRLALKDNMSEHDMLRRLDLRFPSNKGFAMFHHVRNTRGFGERGTTLRTVDALMVGLWPSRGYEVHGFEVKSSRNDFLREMKKPEKAESIAQYCDKWWLVFSDRSIAKDDEIPKGWGLLVPRGEDGLTAAIQPKRNDSAKPLSKSFLVSVLASQHKNDEARASAIRKTAMLEADKKYASGLAQNEKLSSMKRQLSNSEMARSNMSARLLADADRNADVLAKAKELAGMDVCPEDFCAAVKLVRRMRDWRMGPANLSRLVKDLPGVTETLAETLAIYEGLQR